jgi:hypothetical protein
MQEKAPETQREQESNSKCRKAPETQREQKSNSKCREKHLKRNVNRKATANAGKSI